MKKALYDDFATKGGADYGLLPRFRVKLFTLVKKNIIVCELITVASF